MDIHQRIKRQCRLIESSFFAHDEINSPFMKEVIIYDIERQIIELNRLRSVERKMVKRVRFPLID